ncbi:hypothetical protein [Pseudonocardia adelaidensis]|uniref:Uncharacterized protein n=1 Tax=Pseudonocardia adelaidensis TaxID=648754 RepID=A0ABP9PDN1_9PSEU
MFKSLGIEAEGAAVDEDGIDDDRVLALPPGGDPLGPIAVGIEVPDVSAELEVPIRGLARQRESRDVLGERCCTRSGAADGRYTYLIDDSGFHTEPGTARGRLTDEQLQGDRRPSRRMLPHEAAHCGYAQSRRQLANSSTLTLDEPDLDTVERLLSAY